MLYKMYYKSNIELIHLFVTKTKCHIFLQVDIFNKRISNFFREFPVPVPIGTRQVRDGTGHGTETSSRTFFGTGHGTGVSRSCPVP